MTSTLWTLLFLISSEPIVVGGVADAAERDEQGHDGHQHGRRGTKASTPASVRIGLSVFMPPSRARSGPARRAVTRNDCPAGRPILRGGQLVESSRASSRRPVTDGSRVPHGPGALSRAGRTVCESRGGRSRISPPCPCTAETMRGAQLLHAVADRPLEPGPAPVALVGPGALGLRRRRRPGTAAGGVTLGRRLGSLPEAGDGRRSLCAVHGCPRCRNADAPARYPQAADGDRPGDHRRTGTTVMSL